MLTEEVSTRFFFFQSQRRKKKNSFTLLYNCLFVVCCEVKQRMNVLKANLSFISLNTRGLKDNVKRKALFLFCKDQKAHCVFLQETHSCASDTTFWTSQWGDKVLFSHGTNKSAGVAICFNKCPGNVITQKADENGHWLAVVLNIEGSLVILINIYGYSTLNQNKLMLSEISDIVDEYRNVYSTNLILFGGDFNFF